MGKNNIGFLNIQEGKADTVSPANNTVFRYKYDIGEQSYIGGIFTNKINNITSNQVFGLDATYQTSNFLNNKNLVISGKITTSTEDFSTQKNALTYRLFVDYPNDLIDNYIALATMQKDFNPELGYIRRSDYNSYSWHLRITPRIFTKYRIKRMLFKPWGFTAYYTHSTGELESFYNETRPLGAVFQSGERFEVNLIQSYDRIDIPFELTDEIAFYMNYAFTTKLNFSLFTQYNDLDEIMMYNFRLHWIPKVGSDFYFVYNIGYEEQIKQIDYLKPQTTDAAVKLVYRFVF